MKDNDHTRLDPGRIEVIDEAMAEILRRKTPTERLAIRALAIGSKDLTGAISLVASGMGWPAT